MVYMELNHNVFMYDVLVPAIVRLLVFIVVHYECKYVYLGFPTGGGHFRFQIDAHTHTFVKRSSKEHFNQACFKWLVVSDHNFKNIFSHLGSYINWLIDWWFMTTLAIFQLYRGVNKFIINLDTYKTIRDQTLGPVLKICKGV